MLFPGARGSAFAWAYSAALSAIMAWPTIALATWHRRVATIRIADDSVEFRGIVRRRFLPRDEGLRCLRSAFDNWPANEVLFIVHGGSRRRRIRIDSWNWTTPRIREISGVLRARVAGECDPAASGRVGVLGGAIVVLNVPRSPG